MSFCSTDLNPSPVVLFQAWLGVTPLDSYLSCVHQGSHGRLTFWPILSFPQFVRDIESGESYFKS